MQSKHWNHSQTVIHPIVNFYLCSTCGELVTEEHVMVTPDPDHDKFAVRQFELQTMKFLQQQGFVPSCCLQFCDNCGFQYKGYGSFEYLSQFELQTMKFPLPVVIAQYSGHPLPFGDPAPSETKRQKRSRLLNIAAQIIT